LDIYVGTWKQMTDDVKSLIDTLADNGWLIIGASPEIPDEVKKENVRALTDTAQKYGIKIKRRSI
jgi:uroporphyrinogen-III decarboxylase